MSFTHPGYFSDSLEHSDPNLFAAIKDEKNRQQDQIELIASENYVSTAVLQAQGSILTNKTVEGYPRRRYYGGTEFADQVEQLAIDRACQLFNCNYANVQPHSGSNANQAVFLGLLDYDDRILSMDVASGGHISHGHSATQTGQRYQIISYGVNRQTELVDYDEIRDLAKKYSPKLIIAGGSAYARTIDFATFRKISDECGALFLVDMAHFAGLVATGLYANPFPHADVVTTTTYKSLRGARGGIILANNKQLAKKMAASVFPGIQGSVLLHSVAAKAACLGEALRPEFKLYNQAVLNNAIQLAATLDKSGVRIVSGGTDCGLMLTDLRSLKVSGDSAVKVLEAAGLTCNKNLIPFDPQPPEVASGLRLSTNAGTTRGFGEAEFTCIGKWIAEILKSQAQQQDRVRQTREEVLEMCKRFPIY